MSNNYLSYCFHAKIAKILAILCLISSAFLAPVMAGEKYALLIGVSNYPNLEPHLQLQGPANDVVLMKRVLRDKGVAHIQILAEGQAKDHLPTRQAILAALARLTQQVKPDDFVFLYFSGHGSQQPVSPTTKTHHEPDGLDELFLPRDVGHWNDKISAVENAIVDNELNKHITALRHKGAFIWAVFDSCHSGTMTRAIKKNDIRERRVSPRALGVPTQALTVNPSRDISPSQSDSTKIRSPDKTASRGGYVAFYAAQSTETTPEMFLPVGNPGPQTHGLFTYTLAEVLAQHDDITYREAGQLILQRYAAQNYRRPTPLFEGTRLDAPIFGTGAGKRTPQWRIQRRRFSSRMKIAAGQVHRLDKGSILAILPNAWAAEEAALGYAVVIRAATLESHIKTVAHNGKPALAKQDIPGGAYARLVEPKMSLTLRMALPPKPATGTTPNALETQARQVLKEIIESEHHFGVNIAWVQADENADLHLLLKDEQLWLLPPTADLIKTGPQKTRSIHLNTTKADLRDKLVTSFQAIANVLNLLRMSNKMPRGRFVKQIQISASVERADEYKPIEADKIPSLSDGDILTLTLKNNSDTATDVTILYVDSEYGITPMYPAEEGEINRIEAGGNDWLELELYADTAGTERLVVIAVAAQPNTLMKDFSFLAQPRLPRTRGSNKKPSLYDLLLKAGFGTRGAKKRKRFNEALIKVFSWEIAPKSEKKRGIRG